MRTGRAFFGKSLALWAVCLGAVALAGAAGVGLLRDYGRDFFLKREPPRVPQASPALAAEWLKALSAGDLKRLGLSARRIVPESDAFSMPSRRACGLAADFRFRLGFLTDSFNFVDAARWRDLLEMNALAEAFSRGASTPEPLLRAIMEKVANPPPEELAKPKPPPLSAMDVWRAGKGTSDDRLRLLCGFAWQAGYDCRLLGLFKQKGILLRTVAVLEKGSKLWLADCVSGTLWECPDGKPSFAAVERLYPQELQGALQGPFVHFMPAELADFRRSDHLLYKRLAASGAPGLPRFPGKPFKALDKLRAKLEKDDLSSFWGFPFQELASIKGDPAGWLPKSKP